MLDHEELTELWDFSDPEKSRARLRDARERNGDAVERDELTTQVARALGLMERYEEARAELGTVTGDSPVVVTRVALEHGRIANSSGDRPAAVSLFHTARSTAQRAGLTYLEVDALHMLAIADTRHAEDWAEQGIELARSADPQTRRWLIALHNNLGWSHFDVGDYAVARQHFEQAQEWADKLGNTRQQQLAREALAECDAAADDAGRTAAVWDEE